MTGKKKSDNNNKAASGIDGLDHVLEGGFMRNRMHLIQGDPGAGKTTLAMRFLLDGIAEGETSLYITLSEGIEELNAMAKSHGWSLADVHIEEMMPSEDHLQPEGQYTMYHPAEVELNEVTRDVIAAVEKLKPHRVVFDSLSDMRLLAQNMLRYRRQILALKQFLLSRKCTVLLLDDRTSDSNDLHLRSIAHGVVTLDQLLPDFGVERRRLSIVKMRGTTFRGGYHDFTIEKGGLRVYPHLVAAEHPTPHKPEPVSSGIDVLDQLVGGGLPSGSSTLLMGPAGSGKSTLAMQYAIAAAQRGEGASLFTFDERRQSVITRAEGMGMPVEKYIESGEIIVTQIDPAYLSPGRFSELVREQTTYGEGRRTRIVVIDSLNGYLHAMSEERHLAIYLHELLTYLSQQGVLTFLVVAEFGIIGGNLKAPIDASYLADNVILTRYFEADGVVRQAVSVVKKRSGPHERAIREMKLTGKGIEIGPPLNMFSGVLTGAPYPKAGAHTPSVNEAG